MRIKKAPTPKLVDLTKERQKRASREKQKQAKGVPEQRMNCIVTT